MKCRICKDKGYYFLKDRDQPEKPDIKCPCISCSSWYSYNREGEDKKDEAIDRLLTFMRDNLNSINSTLPSREIIDGLDDLVGVAGRVKNTVEKRAN